MAAPRYNEMTPAEREAAFWAQREAVEVHIQGFASRPYRGSYDDERAARHEASCAREARFILRVANKCGDTWPRTQGVA